MLYTTYFQSPNWGVPLSKTMGMSQSCNMTGSNSKYVPRLQSLAGIDEMVQALVHQLEALGALNNTYIMFTSDNGFHLVSNQTSGMIIIKHVFPQSVLSLPSRFLSKCTPGRAGIAGCMLWAFCHITLQGHHALCYEKYTLYEEDIRVPLFIRGPGVKAGVKTDYQVR